MPLKSAPVFRACFVVGALALSAVFAADRKPSLLGATREELLAQFGEPKSHIVAGNREVMVFGTQRFMLRDGKVYEFEDIPVETPRPAPAPAAPKTAPAAGTAEEETPTDAPATKAKKGETAPEGAASRTTPSSAATAGESAGTAMTSTTPPPKPAEPEVQIKSVRPPSATRATPTPARTAPAPQAPAPVAAKPAAPPPTAKTLTTVTPAPAPAAVAPSSTAATPSTAARVEDKSNAETPVAPATKPSTETTKAEAAAPAEVAPTANPAATPNTPVAARETEATATAPTAEATDAQPGPEKEKEKPAATKAAKKNRTAAADGDIATESIFTTQTYVITLVIIVGGVGYLVWRWRQRQLELAASAVSRSPFVSEAPVANTGTRFTPDLLGKLEWKRFEELVASYYNKTGVVASRTKSGPGTPVHIRISWKGEQRPFACVHCIPKPSGLVEATPILSLCEALAAEDIRRGYVVTPGRFSVPARDLAEEKHITLLPGDIFLEKLNALPDNVRAELMKDATAGDYTTPTCPRCEVKMARGSDPSMWQCPQCGTVLPKT